MEKNATDFALMASAFSTDEKMARQVCKLLADGDVNEATARKMLRLVADGKLKSEWPVCNLNHYPTYWYYPQRTIGPWVTWGTTYNNNTSDNVSVFGASGQSTNLSLTAMASAAVEEPAA